MIGWINARINEYQEFKKFEAFKKSYKPGNSITVIWYEKEMKKFHSHYKQRACFEINDKRYLVDILNDTAEPALL